MRLTPSQQAAIAHIEKWALARREQAEQAIEEVRAMSDISRSELSEAVYQMKTNASVALHFHPDRLNAEGQSVVAALAESGFYRNQFETKLSNGKLSPYVGGPRDLWEDSMFGGAFSHIGTSLSDRPKYGALDLMRHSDGPAPRFGSCYFILKPAVSKRCTFSYMDSYRSPAEKGSLQAFDDILAALLTESFERQYALGQRGIMPKQLLAHITKVLQTAYGDPAGLAPARNLNHYIEAQVHGQISLKEDVDRLVADPSFKSTTTAVQLADLCERWGIALRWHGGFRLPVEEVPTDFRGPSMPSLAKRISINGLIDAHAIGVAAADLQKNPQAWKDRGAYQDCLQELKLLWHVLVQYGRPRLHDSI